MGILGDQTLVGHIQGKCPNLNAGQLTFFEAMPIFGTGPQRPEYNLIVEFKAGYGPREHSTHSTSVMWGRAQRMSRLSRLAMCCKP